MYPHKKHQAFSLGNRHHGIHALQIGLSQSYCCIIGVTSNRPTIKLLLVFFA